MRVAFVNGSPRKEQGITARLLRVMEERLPGCEITRGWEEPCDALLIAFPLYVDGIPSNLLRELIAHEHSLKPGTRVYALVNNGFYEGEQNAGAISMLRNWCERAGLVWGQGIGVGAGEILKREPIMAMATVVARGPLKKYNAALNSLAGHILAGEGGEDIYTNPGMPRAMYIFGGNISFRAAAKKNGLSKREIKHRL
ncbi:MAG: hypothetical protein FWC27_00950 [Firmicutes bacterium]|nr:hypothetical protein [Bacillota bacterium]